MIQPLEMKMMLLEHLEDTNPRHLRELRTKGELEPMLESQVRAAQDAMKWGLASVVKDDLAGGVMARDRAVAVLLEYPGSGPDPTDPSLDEMRLLAREIFDSPMLPTWHRQG